MEFSGDIARKRGPADRLAIEAAKTTAAAAVGARSGSFHVPSVVRFDAAGGLLETERVHGFASLLQLVLRRDPRLLDICERVGRALAEVHAELRLPEALRIPLPAPLAGDAADACVLHGDLNGSNVGYDPASGPSRDRRLVGGARAGRRGDGRQPLLRHPVVLAVLLPLPAGPAPSAAGSPERWAGAFLAGYADRSGSFSVDGTNLHDLVKKHAPLAVDRACHYIYAAAAGLQYSNGMGIVHRDIKPGNLLVDRAGVVKVLDMGLARFFKDDDESLTRKFDENVLGTADYLAPEQAIDSHTVDIRADIYSLGGTFYYLLTGSGPVPRRQRRPEAADAPDPRAEADSTASGPRCRTRSWRSSRR